MKRFHGGGVQVAEDVGWVQHRRRSDGGVKFDVVAGAESGSASEVPRAGDGRARGAGPVSEGRS
eukprot:11152812-Lingulodinium_polyedra.AAC.1